MELGKVDLQEEMERRAEELYTPNWFSVELKTGVGGERGVGGREGKGGGFGGKCACATDVKHRTPPSLPPADVDGEVGGVRLLLCVGVSQQVRSERHQHRPQP